jgi:hypothetical protein
MNLDTINSLLPERRVSLLSNAVYKLETGIQARFVRNIDFNDAKDTINRSVEEASESFFKATDGLWNQAYTADALLDGAHTLPTKLKRAQKAGMASYAAFLSELMPLRELLEAAKPLIVKRQDQPKVKTTKQIADEADQMTCQCCARGIFAATGVIAHHGYERPGHGYQTASCMGARALPFEADRKVLAVLIDVLRQRHAGMVERREAIAAEKAPIVRRWKEGKKPNIVHKEFEFTRANFSSKEACVAGHATGLYGGFDDLLQRDLERRAHSIKMIYDDITAQQARYDGWKQTHRRENDKWVEV